MESLELYVHTGGEAGETPRVFLCRPGLDDNVAEVFAHAGIGADELAQRLACSVNAVTRIVALLDDAPEWDSETMGDLANILHDEGFKLRSAGLQTWMVLHRPKNAKVGDPVEGFKCQADDNDHAEEQCENAYPDNEVLWTFIGEDFDKALADYYASGESDDGE